MATVVAWSAAVPAPAATRTWSNAGMDFNADRSWLEGIAPGPNDIALFPATIVVQPVLTGDAAVQGLRFENVSGWALASDASGPWTLTLGRRESRT